MEHLGTMTLLCKTTCIDDDACTTTQRQPPVASRLGSGASVPTIKVYLAMLVMMHCLFGAIGHDALVVSDIEGDRGNMIPSSSDELAPIHEDQTYNTTLRISVIINILSILALLGIVTHMNNGLGLSTGPPWDPNGNVPFRTWVREVQAWLNVSSSRLQPTQQAAAIQLGLRGVAREYAMTISPAIISFGANINGTLTDPVTYLLYLLGNRYEALEDERTVNSGHQLLDFQALPNENIDTLLTRFDMARHEARNVGADIPNFHT